MWKRVIAAEAQEEAQKEEPNCISTTDPITAIHEEEEEQASKDEEEEESTDVLDEREKMPALGEEEILPQSETSGEKEEEPEWCSEHWSPLKPGIWTLSENVCFFPNWYGSQHITFDTTL